MFLDGEQTLRFQGWKTAAALLVLAAVLSKAIGFVRELLIAGYFGVSEEVDAFLLALSLAMLFGSGIGVGISTVAVAFLQRAESEGPPNRAQSLAGRLLVMTAILSLAGIVILIFAPEWLLRLCAPTLSPTLLGRSSEFLPWVCLYVFSLNLIFVQTSIFHARHQFAIPAVCDLLFNVLVILTLLGFALEWGVQALVAGNLIGSGACALVLLGMLMLRRMVSIEFRGLGFGCREGLHLALPVLLLEWATQVLWVVQNLFASRLTAGSVAALSYAGRLNFVLITLVALNLSKGMFPTLTRHWMAGDREAVGEILAKVSRQIIVFFVPVAVLCLVNRDQILGVLYLRGAFDAVALDMTSAAFVFYSLGMVAVLLEPVLTKGSYACSDFRTPMVAMFASTALVILGAVVGQSWGLSWIAGLMNLAVVLRVGVLAVALGRKLRGFAIYELGRIALVASLCAACACVLPFAVSLSMPMSVVWWSTVFLLVYLGTARVFLASEISPHLQMLMEAAVWIARHRPGRPSVIV